MIISVFAAVFMPGISMVIVLFVYGFLYCARAVGLSSDELNKLPKIPGKELVMGTECAVCLDEIGSGEQARMVPGCKHGFHVQCADTWLSKHRVCPICRKQLDSEFFTALENPC